ncbi:MAG: hypothetical protein Q8P67_24975 [archaeon]|nr:hypothetical protein [archaeon]
MADHGAATGSLNAFAGWGDFVLSDSKRFKNLESISACDVLQLFAAVFPLTKLPRYNAKPKFRSQRIDNWALLLQLLGDKCAAHLPAASLSPVQLADALSSDALESVFWTMIQAVVIDPLLNHLQAIHATSSSASASMAETPFLARQPSGIPSSPAPNPSLSRRTSSVSLDAPSLIRSASQRGVQVKRQLFDWCRVNLSSFSQLQNEQVTSIAGLFRNPILLVTVLGGHVQQNGRDFSIAHLAKSPLESKVQTLSEIFQYMHHAWGVPDLLVADQLFGNPHADERPLVLYLCLAISALEGLPLRPLRSKKTNSRIFDMMLPSASAVQHADPGELPPSESPASSSPVTSLLRRTFSLKKSDSKDILDPTIEASSSPNPLSLAVPDKSQSSPAPPVLSIQPISLDSTGSPPKSPKGSPKTSLGRGRKPDAQLGLEAVVQHLQITPLPAAEGPTFSEPKKRQKSGNSPPPSLTPYSFMHLDAPSGSRSKPGSKPGSRVGSKLASRQSPRVSQRFSPSGGSSVQNPDPVLTTYPHLSEVQMDWVKLCARFRVPSESAAPVAQREDLKKKADPQKPAEAQSSGGFHQFSPVELERRLGQLALTRSPSMRTSFDKSNSERFAASLRVQCARDEYHSSATDQTGAELLLLQEALQQLVSSLAAFGVSDHELQWHGTARHVSKLLSHSRILAPATRKALVSPIADSALQLFQSVTKEEYCSRAADLANLLLDCLSEVDSLLGLAQSLPSPTNSYIDRNQSTLRSALQVAHILDVHTADPGFDPVEVHGLIGKLISILERNGRCS